MIRAARIVGHFNNMSAGTAPGARHAPTLPRFRITFSSPIEVTPSGIVFLRAFTGLRGDACDARGCPKTVGITGLRRCPAPLREWAEGITNALPNALELALQHCAQGEAIIEPIVCRDPVHNATAPQPRGGK